MILSKVHKFLLDTLFPINCLSCQREDWWLCRTCLHKIPLQNEQVCPLCEKVITPLGKTCFACKNKYSLDGMLVACSYQNKLVSQAVHLYKYRFVEDISYSLGELLLQSVTKQSAPLPEIIVPVPLHPRRLRWRGFNQANLLARHLGDNLAPGFNIPVFENLLTRKRHTKSQMKIKNHLNRKENIRDAFAINKKVKNKALNRSILLVDDIATTGATIFECARTLKKAGLGPVYSIVIARQQTKKLNNIS